MNRAANRIDDAADALRRHAGRIEAELAVQRAVVHGAEQAAVGLVHGVEAAAGGVAHAGGALLHVVGL